MRALGAAPHRPRRVHTTHPQEAPLDCGGNTAPPQALAELAESAATQLIGPAPLRTKVLSEDKQEVAEGAAKSLLIKRVLQCRGVTLTARPDDAAAPLAAPALLQVRACAPRARVLAALHVTCTHTAAIP